MCNVPSICTKMISLKITSTGARYRSSSRQHQPGVNLRHVVCSRECWTGPVGLRAFSFLGGLSLPGDGKSGRGGGWKWKVQEETDIKI